MPSLDAFAPVRPRMSPYLQIHPTNPEQRLVRHAVTVVRDGGIIVYPTDSCYALGCQLGNKAGMERIRRIRQVDVRHDFTLVCRDLSELGSYAKVENWAFRALKSHTPGPYTFILKATSEVPRRLQNPRRKTIGLRVPDHPVTAALLERLGEPLMSSTLLLPGDDEPLSDPQEMRERLAGQVDLVVDGGYCGRKPTTVIDLTDGSALVLRRGLGDVSAFE